MTDLVIVEHRLDEDAGVYVVVVGTESKMSIPVASPDGAELLDRNGDAISNESVERVPLEDFVFAADDERWAGKDRATVAAEQRELVREALAARDRQQHARGARAGHVTMPGVGEAL